MIAPPTGRDDACSVHCKTNEAQTKKKTFFWETVSDFLGVQVVCLLFSSVFFSFFLSFSLCLSLSVSLFMFAFASVPMTCHPSPLLRPWCNHHPPLYTAMAAGNNAFVVKSLVYFLLLFLLINFFFLFYYYFFFVFLSFYFIIIIYLIFLQVHCGFFSGLPILCAPRFRLNSSSPHLWHPKLDPRQDCISSQNTCGSFLHWFLSHLKLHTTQRGTS